MAKLFKFETITSLKGGGTLLKHYNYEAKALVSGSFGGTFS